MGKSDYLRLRTLNKFGRAAARMIKAPPIKVVGVRISEKNKNPNKTPKRCFASRFTIRSFLICRGSCLSICGSRQRGLGY